MECSSWNCQPCIKIKNTEHALALATLPFNNNLLNFEEDTGLDNIHINKTIKGKECYLRELTCGSSEYLQSRK
jgi:hypothetical protein